MKKLCFLLFLTMFGISTLDAQNSMERDRTKLPKSTLEEDSSHPSKTMQRDSSQLYKSSMDTDHGKVSKSNMPGDNGKNDDKRTKQDHQQMLYDVSMWPEASRDAAEEITAKYGKPDEVTSDEQIWKNKGPWEKICVTKMESKHSFPIEHTDMMATTIKYKVPVRKMDDLGKFDGSVTFDRTQGTLTARCDKEANNFLALNLANDIVTGQKSVQRARAEYGNIIREKMNGGTPVYMEKLTFSTSSNTVDPDINTTGLTKADVTKAVMANNKSRK